MMIIAWLAALPLLIGAACFYLAAPHQIVLKPPVSGRALQITGAVALLASLVLLLTQMGSATAVFTWTVGLMVLWSVPPIVIRWLRFRKETAG
ncbi:MAG: hypothetical protein QM690_01600 [Sphingobium sp.]